MAKPLQLIQSLRLWDVVAMNIVAVVGLRWITRSARVGAPSVTLWILACLAFFVPLAAVLAELSSRHPRAGRHLRVGAARVRPGARLRLRLVHVGEQPVLLSRPAAVRRRQRDAGARRDGPALDDNRLYSVAFVLGGLWFCTLLNIVGFSAGKWVQHLGSVATWIPAAIADRLRRDRASPRSAAPRRSRRRS